MGGTVIAAIELTRLSAKTARKKAMTTCIKCVAEKLGNTPKITKKSYIDPRIFKMYDSSDRIASI